MRKLGEQWIEDGRMYKAIEPVTPMSCARCDVSDGTVCCSYQNVCGCKREPSFIIKDLGPVDSDGMLGCPFCGEFLTECRSEGWCWYECNDCGCEGAVYRSKQEAKDAMNRRNA